MDFHCSKIIDGFLCVSFQECVDILSLMHDVEYHNSKSNFSAGIMKGPFQAPINTLGFTTTENYEELRNNKGLVKGKMTLGTHGGSPLDYGYSNHDDECLIKLDISKLNIKMNINANTGIIYGTEDKLKAFRNSEYFINKGYYFDLMPKHDCMIEIYQKMACFDKNRTLSFVLDELKWIRL